MSTQKETKPVGEVRNFMGQTVIHGPTFNTIPDGTKIYTQPGTPEASANDTAIAWQAALSAAPTPPSDDEIGRLKAEILKLRQYRDKYLLSLESQCAAPTPPEVELLAFDLGSMNNYGGGNVEWWWDYIRDSLRLAHEHYQEQVSDLVNTRPPAPNDWFSGEVDCDGNELITIRKDSYDELRAAAEKVIAGWNKGHIYECPEALDAIHGLHSALGKKEGE